MKTIIVLLIWLFPSLIYGQSFIFKPIAANDALPSKETYHIFQDTEGYIWIATELGLCQLDGDHIKIFDHKNELPEKAIYAVKNHRGTVWMVSSTNRILTLKKGRLREHPLSKAFQKAISSADAPSYAIHFTKNKVIINSKWCTFELDTTKGTINKIPIDDKNAVLHLGNGELIPYNSLFYRPVKHFQLEIDLSGGKKKSIKIPYRGSWYYRFLSCKINDSYFFSYNNQLIKIKPDLSIETHSLPSDISYLYVDKDNDLWIGMQKKGLLHYPKGEIKTNPISALSDYSVVGIYQDRENNIWCTTLEKGVFMTKSKQVIDYSNKLGPYYGKALIMPIENGIAIMKDFTLYVVDGGRNMSTYTVKDKLPNEKKGIISLMKATQQYAVHFSTLTQYDFVQGTNEEELYSVTYYHLNSIKKGILTNFSLPSRGRCVALLNDSLLLVGCNNGIYSFHTKTQQLTKIATTANPVTRFFVNSSNETLVATKGDGVFKLKNKELMPFKLPADIVYDIKEDSFKNIWLATNKGLIKLQPNYETKLYTMLHGLPANDIYRLAISNDLLYLLSAEGLASIPLSHELLNKTPMSIYLKLAMADTIPLDFSQPTKLKYNQNSISLLFNRLSFKNNNHLLRYKLSPLDQQYQISNANEISLKNLPPNTYQLTVYGVNSDKIESKPIYLNFTIEKPFWQKWWFITLCIALIALTIYMITYNIFQNIKKKEKEKTRINKLIAENQLAALQAQMNPHFVFNCINSIQKYILKKEEKKAYDYLANFSKLIRMVLHHAQDKNVTLHNELELLNLYVSLEQMRFKDGFEYVTEIDEALDTHNILIPSMLLQPYIENAIWHGLMNLDKEKKGILLLKIKQAENNMLITIEDNGVGRKQAMAYKVDNLHRPVAVNLNQQRINVLNQMYKNDSFCVEITDKYDELGNAKGTIVSILLPLNYE